LLRFIISFSFDFLLLLLLLSMSTQEWSSKVYKSITNFHFFFYVVAASGGRGKFFLGYAQVICFLSH
jgi:predicted membrane protein